MDKRIEQIVMDLRALAVRMANVALNMKDYYPDESAALQETSISTGLFADKVYDEHKDV